MKGAIAIFLLFFASGLIFGCSFLPPPSPTFEGGINFSISAGASEAFEGVHISLSVSTADEFGCSNYYLSNSIIREGGKIKVILGDVIESDFCLTSIGPAIFSGELDLETGAYTLEFHSKNGVDEYSLEVTDDAVTIVPITANFSAISRKRIPVGRLPKNLLYATCFYGSDSRFNPHDDFCERFYEDVGELAQPYLTARWAKMPKEQFYIYTGSDQALIDIIHKYDRDGFYVRFVYWNGSEFKNFICPFNCDAPGDAQGMPLLEISHYPYHTPYFETDISQCGDNRRCMLEAAVNTKNEEICRQFSGISEDLRLDCLGEVGIAKQDLNLCAESSHCSRSNSPCFFIHEADCYTYVAIQQSKPELCESILEGAARAKEICKYNCENIDRDRREATDTCYYAYAGDKNDMSACSKIASEKTKQECIENVG